jgi:hypothetical protein
MTAPFRIATGQSFTATAKQALMIGAGELGLFAYREPYQLGDEDQRASLLHTLNTEFDTSIPLPSKGTRSVYYLIVLLDERQPVIIPESEVVAFVFGYVLGKAGIDAARRVSYRPDMLPASSEEG